MPVSKPGVTTRVEVDLRSKTATIEREDRGLGDALNYLHKMPGPHNVQFRGNWVFMTWWAFTTDVVVYGILFLTASGLYLWWKLKAERVAGWALVGGGAATVALLVGASAGTAIGTAQSDRCAARSAARQLRIIDGVQLGLAEPNGDAGRDLFEVEAARFGENAQGVTKRAAEQLLGNAVQSHAVNCGACIRQNFTNYSASAVDTITATVGPARKAGKVRNAEKTLLTAT